MTIRVTFPEFCVAAGSVEALKRCKTFKARLIGPGINAIKRFAMLEIDGDPLIADCVTGTVYDADGRHISSVLRVTDFPRISPHDIPLWLKAEAAERSYA